MDSSPESSNPHRVASQKASDEAPHGQRWASLGPNHEESHLTESDLKMFWVQYFIFSSFRLVAPGRDDRVLIPPKDRVIFYEKPLLSDLRFHLHPFICNILDYYHILLTQIASNEIRSLMVFILIYDNIKISL